ncbi:bifunctional methylenetetrahydrofolate dehydrogenase/methenyltetrahydrofolate cyclohydrolase FolD [bacterium]|nr:bifunctional methylenetetrahydrofolate dehydrogenase/methenyltetrahydrofolate cyclohydrolase FolD [bacterium]
MTAKLIDGRAIAAGIRAEIRDAVAERRAAGQRPPGLAVAIVGENPASQSYVRMKRKACEEVGFLSEVHALPVETSQAELLALVQELNSRDEIDGILVQLPLPPQIDESLIINAIDPEKDVDGFHPINVGRLVIGERAFVPCTPLGIQELLIRSDVETRGKFAVVVGRSNIVGKPIANLLTLRGRGGDATVCVCHSATPDLDAVTRQADILIAAMGRPQAIKADMIKPGAVVIDVGINRVPDASRERGYRIVGDVDFEPACEVASQITPVPRGVGPMTIAMLLRNTLDAAQRRE